MSLEDYGGPVRMPLDLKETFNSRLITPYHYKDRTYYLLFYGAGKPGPFYVEDSPVQPETLIYIGDIRQEKSDALVGNCFFTQAPALCAGSYLLAYSGVFRQVVNNRIPKDFGMDLVLKTNRFQIFNQKNKATLIISPSLKSDIRQNLEI